MEKGKPSKIQGFSFLLFATVIIVLAARISLFNPAGLWVLVFVPVVGASAGAKLTLKFPEAVGFWGTLVAGSVAAVALGRKAAFESVSPEAIFWLNAVMFITVGAYAGAVLARTPIALWTARAVLGLFGGFWLLFALLGHGFSLAGLSESLFGAGLLAAAGLSFLAPVIGGIVGLGEAGALLWMLLSRSPQGIGAQVVLVGLVLPTLSAAIMLIGAEPPKGRRRQL